MSDQRQRQLDEAEVGGDPRQNQLAPARRLHRLGEARIVQSTAVSKASVDFFNTLGGYRKEEWRLLT